MREIAQKVGITERAVMRIVKELTDAGFLTVDKIGRVNRYTVVENLALRHPLEHEHSVGELFRALSPDGALSSV